MQEFDIPIFKKSYDLYKLFHTLRNKAPKLDRYTVIQKCEGYLLDVIEGILRASQLPKDRKLPVLEEVNVKLELLKVFLRLLKDIKSLDLKNYALMEESADEIGRMLGGWIKSTKDA